MPWTSRDYPDTFKNLTPDVREKAIDIANELLDQYNEGRSIRIAMAQAKEWASNRDMQIWADGAPERQGHDVHVVPHDQQWAVKSEHAETADKVVDTKDAALDRARDLAGERQANVVIHDHQGQIEDVVEPG